MASCVYCICRSEAQAVRIANRLYSSGFSANDISMLHPDKGGTSARFDEVERAYREATS